MLDREQAGASVEVLKQDLEHASQSRGVRAQRRQLEQAFGPDSGHVTRVLERHFGAESSTAVQHQVRTAVAELLSESREKLFKQFSLGRRVEPAGHVPEGRGGGDPAVVRPAARPPARDERPHRRAPARAAEAAGREGRRRLEVAAEHDRSTAKGRPYEEAVFEAVDAIAAGQGDDCDAVGDLRGVGGRKGDVVVDLDGCSGRPRGRIVFEAKNSKRSRNEALAELDEAMNQRAADYAVWVVPSEDKLPARAAALREVNGDKLFVVYDPEEGSRLALEVAYSLARARVLMAKGGADGLDASALRAEVERAMVAMEDVRRIKSQLTSAANQIEDVRTIVDGMAERVRGHLAQIDAMVAEAADD